MKSRLAGHLTEVTAGARAPFQTARPFRSMVNYVSAVPTTGKAARITSSDLQICGR